MLFITGEATIGAGNKLKPKPFQGKWALVTGASSGIGKETTLYFAKNNWTVIATMIAIDLADDLATTPNVF